MEIEIGGGPNGGSDAGQAVGESVIVVSGLPRSGTSMMMKMLEAGGMGILTDETRKADDDNPNGYYELEIVKTLKRQEDKLWIEGARGKAIKIISALLNTLPGSCHYQVVFMNRDLGEVIASQNKMRARRGDDSPSDDEEMALLFGKHLEKMRDWVARQPNFDVINVGYREVLEDPVGVAERIKAFLGKELDVEKMSGVFDERLYHNRQE